MACGDELVESRQEIVTRYDPDSHVAAHTTTFGDTANGLRARRRIHTAGVRDHAHTPLRDRR
jgi:hypothetical protein